MKRFLLISVIFFIASIALYAQQGNNPTSAQTKQNAQQFLNEAKSNDSQFQSDLNELKKMNLSIDDLSWHNRLKHDINRLEKQITEQEKSIRVRLEKGNRVSTDNMERFERIVNQHGQKVKELNSFVSNVDN